MGNSDPRMRMVLAKRLNSDFHSILTSNTGPILVFPRIQPSGPDEFSSRGKMYSRHVTGSVNCENSSVSCDMKYCPTSTVVKNPASVQNLINRSCCDSLSTRSWYLCNSACVLRAPHQLTRPAFDPGANTFPSVCDLTATASRAHPLPATPCQCPRSRTATLG